MYQFLTKNGQLIALGVGALVIIIFVITALTGLSGMGIDFSTNLNDLDKEVVNEINVFNLGLKLTIVLIIVALISWVVFGILTMVSNPTRSVKSAIPFAMIVVLFIILYATATAESSGKIFETIQKFNITDNISKLISGALWTAVALIGIALVSLLFYEVRNTLK